MANVDKVSLRLKPLTETDLINDLKFLYHNRTDTVDQFIDEALSLFDQHFNDRLSEYQESVINEATTYFQGEMAHVLTKTRRKFREDRTVDKLEARASMKEEKDEEPNKDIRNW